MLSLFSRSRPATSTCRCITCYSIGVQAALRRSAGASVPSRFQFKHLTTFFYSSLIATAAAADVKVKRQRRDQWDRVIREAEESLRGSDSASDSIDDVLTTSDEAKDQQGSKVMRNWDEERNVQDEKSWKLKRDLSEERELKQERVSREKQESEHEQSRQERQAEQELENEQQLKRAQQLEREQDLEKEQRHREKQLIKEDDEWREALWLQESETPWTIGRFDPIIEGVVHSLDYASNDYGNDFTMLHDIERLVRKASFGYPSALPAERGRPSTASIYASDFRSTNRQQPLTPKKLVTLEFSMAKLSTRFLLECNLIQLARVTDKTETLITKHDLIAKRELIAQREMLKKSLAEINERLELMKSAGAFDLTGVERLQYPQYDYEGEIGEAATEQLNVSLISVMSRYASRTLDLDTALNKLAYNFMVSPAPPSTKTYTFLINRFIKYGHGELAEMVVDSMNETHTRPNEMTVDTMINYYSRRYLFASLAEYLDKLQGNGKGLMLAKPTTPLEGVGASRLKARGDKVVQAMTLDPQIFHSIISALLKSLQFEEAQKWWCRMRDQDIEATPRLLARYLIYFQHVRDWRRGHGLWAALKSDFLARPLDEMSDPELETVHTLYYWMMRLCNRCARPAEFKVVYQEALTRGFSLAAVLLGPNSQPKRRFTVPEKADLGRRRRLRVLEYRVQLIAGDLRIWAVHVLAAKIVLAGLPVQSVERMFSMFVGDDGGAYAKWRSQRPPRSWKHVGNDGALNGDAQNGDAQDGDSQNGDAPV